MGAFASFGSVAPIREGNPMARHHLLIVTASLLLASSVRAGDSVIDMPPPPKKAPAVATSPEEPSARATVTVGDVALHRYRRARVGPSFTSYPWRSFGYRGPTIFGFRHHPHHFYPFGFWGFGHGIFHGTLLGHRPFFFGGHTTVTFH